MPPDNIRIACTEEINETKHRGDANTQHGCSKRARSPSQSLLFGRLVDGSLKRL